MFDSLWMNRTVRRMRVGLPGLLAGLVLTAALAVGCSSETEEATVPPDSMRTCSVDDDCAVYEAGCCDHCNGGYVFSVNKASLTEAKSKHKASCGTDVACTLMGCAEKVPVCESGLCAHKDGTR